MTTTIKITSHNYPALVSIVDRGMGGRCVTTEVVLRPEDGEQSFYCTTTRTIEVVDLEANDPRLVEGKGG